MKKGVVVVGAGISGLAAAKVLLDHNYDVTVLEASTEQIGGRASFRREIGKFIACFHIKIQRYWIARKFATSGL